MYNAGQWCQLKVIDALYIFLLMGGIFVYLDGATGYTQGLAHARQLLYF